jgi:branched-chain amino acid transport system substrate-binding protein
MALFAVLPALGQALAATGAAPPVPTAPAPSSVAPATAGGGAAATAPVPALTGGSVVVGEFGSMTGQEATFGLSTHEGILLAIEETNAAGGIAGKRIELKSYDDQGKPDEAATAVTKLITRDKVAAILGEVASSRSLAGAPIANAAKVPMVSPSSTNPKVTEVGPYIFRVCFIDPFQGEVMAAFAADAPPAGLGARTAAILRDVKSDYSIGLADFFKRAFEARGGVVVADEAYASGDFDFKAQLTAIRAGNPDVLFVPGYYTDVGLIARQVRELNIIDDRGAPTPLLGGDGWDSEHLTEIGGRAIEGSYFSNHYSSDSDDPIIKAFVARYKAKFGRVPDAIGVLGYEAAMVLFSAMRRAPALDGDSIRAALASTKGFPGVTGKITLDEHRNAVKPAVVLRVDHGRYAYIRTIPPEGVAAGSVAAGVAPVRSGTAVRAFFQHLVNGLALGAIYALVALGYTMVYGVLKLINFAHSDVYMVSAFIGYYAARALGFDAAPSLLGSMLVLLISMMVAAALGMTIERLAYRPLRKAPRIAALTTAIGVSLLLEYGGQIVFGADPKFFPEMLPLGRPLELGGVVITSLQMVVLLVGLALMVGLEALIYRTRLGRAMRAVSFDPEAASLMGIRVDRAISLTFAIGSALAAAAGVLVALSYPKIEPLMGVLVGLKAFVAAVLGGIGSVHGALVGGLLMGLSEELVSGYVSSTFRDALAFVILIVVLLVRPGGLFGRSGGEKV